MAAQGSERGLLGTILIRRGLIDVDQLGTKHWLSSMVFRTKDIIPESVRPQVVRLLPEGLAQRSAKLCPVNVSGSTLTLAMTAPDDMDAICEAELITGYHVEPVVAMQSGIRSALDRGFDERVLARQTIVDMKMADLDAAEEAIDHDLDRRSRRRRGTGAGGSVGESNPDGRH